LQEIADSTEQLTPKQHKAIAALMSNTTIAAAAKAAGVSERVLYNWLDEPTFTTSYRVARREAVQIATARLQQISGAAVAVLGQLMVNGTPAIKLGAARTVLDLAIKAIELDDIQARLTALEAKHAEKL
jgi:hypothetical protein